MRLAPFILDRTENSQDSEIELIDLLKRKTKHGKNTLETQYCVHADLAFDVPSDDMPSSHYI